MLLAATLTTLLAVRPIELPEVAVCLSGAARSFATVPVLRGLKRNVLQSRHYSASAFAALSYDTASPQALEYNVSLTRRLSSPSTVRRALGHLRPELVAVAFYNSTDALERFRSCRASDRRAAGTEVLALYSAQLCFSLVRQHEAARGHERGGSERFDFILRVRPDQLFLRPLPEAIGLNVSAWPRDRLLTHDDNLLSFAIVPSASPVAALYFRTFASAGSCVHRERDGPERMPETYPAALQCARLQPYEGLARCVVLANLRYHALPPPATAPGRPALLARVCNLNHTTRQPAWPAWPMPKGETCITALDALRRPRRGAADAEGSGGAQAPNADGGNGLWHLTVLVAVGGVAFAMYSNRERLMEDGQALMELASVALGPTLEEYKEKIQALGFAR